MSGSDAPVRLETEAEVLAHLGRLDLDDEERRYVDLMLPRYVRALEIVGGLLSRRSAARPGAELQILEVAPHLLTDLFASAFEVRVNTVGVRYRTEPHSRMHDHLDLDLNDLHERDGWPGFWKHDVVFMGEIIEHLWASPRMVIGGVARWVAEGGHLVVQTPNAAALDRRLTLLRGRNPYEMLREGRNPGHIREYTADELVPFAAEAGLELERVHYENYFRLPDRGRFKRAWYGALTRLRGTLRDGMTLVFRKREGHVDPVLHSRLVQGGVEHLDVEGGRAVATGWAVDARARVPVGRFEVWAGDRVLHQFAPAEDRPDVAASLGDPALTRCGFRVRVSLGDLDPAALRLRAYDAFGDAADLGSR